MTPGLQLRRLRVPVHLSSVAAVGLGFAVVGAGTAVSLAAAARSLDTHAFSLFATWLTVANLAGLAFVVVEGYLPRLVLAARSRGEPERPLVGSFTYGLVGAVGLVTIFLLILSSPITRTLFGGRRMLLLLVAGYMLAAALQSLQRAVAVGRECFRVFSWQLGVDGGVRLAGSVALAIFGRPSVDRFAGLICGAAVAGLVAGTMTDRHWTAWRGQRTAVALAPLGLLAVGSVGPLIVNSAGVPWLTATGKVPAATVGAVAGALTLSRIPTLLVGAAYGPILAPLSRAVDDRSQTKFRGLHRRSLAAAIGLAVSFVVIFALAGPRLLTLYLGPSFHLQAGQIALLAGGSGLMFACVVEQAALAALAAWRRVAGGWLVGIATFAVVLVTPVQPVTRVVLAGFLSPLAAAGTLMLARSRAQRAVFRTLP